MTKLVTPNSTDLSNMVASAMAKCDLDVSVIRANEEGYNSNFDGVLLRDNPYNEGSPEFRAWDAGHVQAQSVRVEWEESL